MQEIQEFGARVQAQVGTVVVGLEDSVQACLIGALAGGHVLLEGAPAHGVPFTAEISTDGLLSWARDPPRHWPISEGAETSWREWICLRSAHALVDSRNQADNPDACCRLALARLRAEGVDTDRWSPNPALWGRRRW